MTMLHMLLGQEALNEYLTEHGLTDGFVPIEAALLQYDGTREGAPCVMLVLTVDGKKVLAKVTLAMFETAAKTMRAGYERECVRAGLETPL